MMKFRGIFKQQDTGKSWGYIAQVATQAGIFITIINMFMLAATFYTTTFSPWLRVQGIVVSFWVFVGVLVAFLAVLVVLLYKFAMPSFFSVFNDQFYKHNNLLRRDMDAIKKKLGIEEDDSDSARN